MPADRRKPRPKPAPYNCKPRKKADKDVPVTAAKMQSKKTRENLSLHDWLTVFAYINEHPGVSQEDIVGHFASKTDGSLHFTQSTLSRKLKMRQQLEEQVHDNPNALSGKRHRIVTRPDVEEALVQWVQQMENKSEHVTGTMLQEKRRRFENLLEVPENERLTGEGWVTSFKKAYKLREIRCHGEAASVDPNAVEAEREEVSKILEKYPPADRWNFDKTSLFAL